MISTVAAKAGALTLLGYVANLLAAFAAGRKNSSLTSLTKSTRVEPIALVDSALVHQSYITDLMQSANARFLAYYMQGVAALGTSVNGVTAARILDQLNPSRDLSDAAASKLTSIARGTPSMLSFESYRYGLPQVNYNVSNEAVFGVPTSMKDMEEANARKERERADKDAAAKADAKGGLNTIGDNKTLDNVSEAINLSVGRMFEVNLNIEGQPVKVPVSVRLIATTVNSEVLAHILGAGSRNNTFRERFHMWRAGQLEFIKDIVFMQDLVDKQRKLLAKDTTGVYKELMDRRRRNGMAGALTGTPSVGSASNIVFISSRTAKMVEKDGGGRFSDAKFRERLFEDVYIMILYVVDEATERVTIYERDNPLPIQLSIKQLKVSNKSGGPDVMEIMKAYQMGNSSRF